ncbi:MAG: Undecaprenyl-phosphate galactose phosphotransferase [Microbacteriaceae bacterium]|nr:Undecaprenyl-phosphate galactose phosphotransferase [Microbacteriaceae bacterium]
MKTRSGVHQYDALKRVLDAFFAALGLLVSSPALVVVALLVFARLGRPVIFSQERPGRDGQIFRLYKFRTMKQFDTNKQLVTDEQRLTRFGRLLRSTSLDELPTLLNVLRGDMSVVGPRPLLSQYLDRYTPDQARRHDVRPGITGLAQVNGRNLLSWDEKFALDLQYIEGRRLGLDLKIVVATIGAVFSRSGISAPGEATASEFMGTDGIDLSS